MDFTRNPEIQAMLEQKQVELKEKEKELERYIADYNQENQKQKEQIDQLQKEKKAFDSKIQDYSIKINDEIEKINIYLREMNQPTEPPFIINDFFQWYFQNFQNQNQN